MRNIPLRQAIAVVLLASFLFSVIIAGWLTLIERKKSLRRQLESDHARIVEILALGLQESVWALYAESGLSLVEAIMTDERVVHVTVETEDGVFIEKTDTAEHEQTVVRSRPISYHGADIGRVVVEVDVSHLHQALVDELIKYLLVIVIPFLVSLAALYSLLQFKILKPLEQLISQSERLAEKNLASPFTWRRSDEMGMLGQSLEVTRRSLYSAFSELEEMHRQAVDTSRGQEEINRRLEHEIAERRRIEERLQHHKKNLEMAVSERTAELVEANDKLHQEIEERKRSEEERRRITLKLHQVEKMEALGLLASSVAHDLNNILSGIVSYPDLLLMRIDSKSDIYQHILEIQKAGKRATSVVADLLTIARSTATTFVAHDLNRLVDGFFQLPEFERLEGANSAVALEIELGAEETTVICSPVHVKKCFMNLITNAYEACAGKGTIAITTANELVEGHSGAPADGRYVVLSICDSGPGISDEDREHIFEPFYSTKQMGMNGSGLGLTIVSNAMDEHSGTVMAENTGEGTCFRLYFPVAATEAEEAEMPVQKREYSPGNNELILVVDDEELILTLSRRMLEDLNYRVETVSSGEEALDVVRRTPVDAVILDMVMEPGINGRQTYERILEVNPDQKAMLVSGFAMNEDVRAAMAMGVAVFLKKPFTVAQLAGALQRTLST